MPENLTRREFIKDLGKFGAAAALAPMVAVGEQASDKAYGVKRPGFIKEVEQSTTEIDWKQVQRYNETHTCRAGFVTYIGEDRLSKLNELRASNLDKYLKENRPGYTLKDVALQSGVGGGAAPRSFIGRQKAKTPEDLGVPKWTGTPEEASQVITAAMRHFGAASVGFLELDTNTTE